MCETLAQVYYQRAIVESDSFTCGLPLCRCIGIDSGDKQVRLCEVELEGQNNCQHVFSIGVVLHLLGNKLQGPSSLTSGKFPIFRRILSALLVSRLSAVLSSPCLKTEQVHTRLRVESAYSSFQIRLETHQWFPWQKEPIPTKSWTDC